MRQVLEIPWEMTKPTAEAVLQRQGVPVGQPGQERPLLVAQAALEELQKQSTVLAVLQPVSAARFAEIYQGLGNNDPRDPVGNIYPRAESLFLFAATAGTGVVSRIQQLFAEGDFPLAMALDAAASLAADLAAAHLEKTIARDHQNLAALRYSPGYCGWHVSGQGALFEELQPADIGLGLTESFVMVPVKSVSGVIVVGPGNIHRFRPEFGFCRSCTDRTCGDRIASLDGNNQE